MPLGGTTTSSLRSRGQNPSHLSLAPPSTPGGTNALGPDGQPLPSPSKAFPHPTYNGNSNLGSTGTRMAAAAGVGAGKEAVGGATGTAAKGRENGSGVGGKRPTKSSSVSVHPTKRPSSSSSSSSAKDAQRPTLATVPPPKPSSDPDDGRSPVRMSPSSPLFPPAATPSPGASPYSTPSIGAATSQHGRAKSSPGALNEGFSGQSRPNSWIVPSPVLASPSSRLPHRCALDDDLPSHHHPSSHSQSAGDAPDFGALGIVISSNDQDASSSSSASATSSPSTSSLDAFSPFGGAFAAMTRSRSPKVGVQTYAAYPTPSHGASRDSSVTPKANGMVGGYPTSQRPIPPQSSPLVRTYGSQHRGSFSTHDAMSAASPPPPYPISPLPTTSYRSSRPSQPKNEGNGALGALRNALKRLYSDPALATVPPGPDRTIFHQHHLSLVDPSSSKHSILPSALKSFLSAPSDPFADSHSRSPPPPPLSEDGRFEDTGASSATIGVGANGFASRGASPTHSRRQTSGPGSTARFEKSLLLGSSTSTLGSSVTSTGPLSPGSFLGSIPGSPLGGGRRRVVPTPSNVRRLLSWLIVGLVGWTTFYLLLRLSSSLFPSGPDYSSPSTWTGSHLDRHGIFAAHATVARDALRTEKERMKTTVVKNGKQVVKTLSPTEEKQAKLRAVAKQAAEKAKEVAALLPLTGPARRYRYGANFQPADTDSHDSDQAGDNDNGLRKIAFNPTTLLREGRKKYLSERSYWSKFEWAAPKVHDSLTRWEKKLQGDERKVRGVVWGMREYGARGVGIGLQAGRSDASEAKAKTTKKVEAAPAKTKVVAPIEDTPVEDLDAEEIDLEVPVEVQPTSEDVSEDVVVETISSQDSDPIDVAAANVDRPGIVRRSAIPDVADEDDEADDERAPPMERRPRLGKRLAPLDLSQTSVFDVLRRAGTPPKPTLAALTNFSLGSLTKWVDLVAEESAIVNGHSPQCGAGATAWMREYAEMHRLVSTGEGHGRFLTYICESGMNCGGLGDRLLGMTSGFLFSLVTGRAFHAEWQAPIPMDVVFDSPNIDWSFSSFTAAEHPVFGQQELVEQARELDIIHFNAESTDRVFGTRDWDAPIINDKLTKGMEARDLAFAAPWIKFFTNRGMIYRAFRYRRLQSRLHELELKPHTAFSCILSYLFTPKHSAREFINAYTSVFSLPSVFSVGIQIRTGDMSMKDPTYDKQNTIEVHKEFFQCADQLAQTYALPDQKVLYYLVTDSAHLRQDAMNKLKDRVVVSGLGITHIHQKSGHADGVYNAVIEEWMLAKTDYRVITQDSGFGKLASFAAAKLASTVTIFPSRNLDVSPLKGKKARTKVDCRLESAFVTFGDLSGEWSLG